MKLEELEKETKLVCPHVYVKVVKSTLDIPTPYMYCTRCGNVREV